MDLPGVRLGAALACRAMDEDGMRELVERVVGRLDRRLADEDWVRAGPADDDFVAFVRERGEGLAFELGVDLTASDYGLSLNPSLGVRHTEVDRLARQFYGLPSGACQVGVGLADLLYRAGRGNGPPPRWIVRSPEEADAAVDLVHADLVEYGSPFLARFATLDDVIAALEAMPRSQHDNGHLAIAYALGGRTAQAEVALAEFAAEAAGQPPFVAEQSQRFLRSFSAHFGRDDRAPADRE